MRTVMVFGTFDIVHPGHLFLFKEAKKHGDRLIAVVARDATVMKMKGRAPHHDERERRRHVLETSLVDDAVIGGKSDYYAVLEEYTPDVICLGYDQRSIITEKLQNELASRGLKALIVHLPAFKEHIYKSSKLRSRLKKTNKDGQRKSGWPEKKSSEKKSSETRTSKYLRIKDIRKGYQKK